MSTEEKMQVDELVEMLRPLSDIDKKIILNNISVLKIRADIEKAEAEKRKPVSVLLERR